jgi:hypothetical protein
MVEIQNKRLMLSEGIECNFTPNLNDFMFFGGGGKGGGKTKVVYVPQTVKETVVKKAPDSVKQEGTSSLTEDGVSSTDDEITGGRSKTLGGTRKLAIPVTPSR